MPIYHLQCQDPIEALYKEVCNLQRLVKQLSASSRPTIPIYSGASLPPDLHDGEVYINSDDGQLYYMVNGNLYSVIGTPT